ncbi:TMEM165/GDT1 family protein [Sphingobium sp. CR2-8]|uniref:TMEM165/GDT1 family protein n=1 Tax=Sphingobium sp. CR2-8 TaxID=1306534 RepID=UPI002DBA881C|nr:TMEM165/GDT1 family protein [Sphingobium sp. CR2-8]MEC3912532.1 TMEM165/GDT1 family protein [Sphingobium sp. CR2-8]
MDALLLALLGCLLGEIGDKGQWLVLALATRYDRNGAIIAGIILAAIANAAISAFAGAWIGPMLGADARLLFMALSVLFLGAGLFWPVSAPDPLAGWPTGAFLTTTLGLLILGFGDGPQFLVLGIATRTADPLLAGVGGAIGVIAALVPVVLLRGRILSVLPLRAIRWIGGALLLLSGAIMALSATSLL